MLRILVYLNRALFYILLLIICGACVWTLSIGTVLGTIFFPAFGVILLVPFNLQRYWDLFRSRRWRRTLATVFKSSHRERPRYVGRHGYFKDFVLLNCGYVIDGRQYRGTCRIPFIDQDAADNATDARVMNQIYVAYDPTDPSRIVAEPYARWRRRNRTELLSDGMPLRFGNLTHKAVITALRKAPNSGSQPVTLRAPTGIHMDRLSVKRAIEQSGLSIAEFAKLLDE